MLKGWCGVRSFLDIALTIAGVMMAWSELLHRAKGDGLSSLSGSTTVEKNLDRITIVVGLVWIIAVAGFGLEIQFT